MQESLNTMEGDPQQRHGRHQYPGHEGRAAPDLTPRTAAVIEASEREGTAMAQLGALFTLPQGELRAVLERMGSPPRASRVPPLVPSLRPYPHASTHCLACARG